MSLPAAPPSPPSSGLALRARRCARHPAREAVARCPACRGFFCRECTVEHDGQLVCASCLARQAATASGARASRGARTLREAAALTLGLLLLWFLFYQFGALLLRIPPGVHDGTIWQRHTPRADAPSD